MEYIEAFGFLCKALEEYNLGWLVQQVRDEIEAGKLANRRIATWKDGVDEQGTLFQSAWRRDHQAIFTVIEKYEAAEKLRMLIDAIERVVVESAAMEKSLIDTLSSDGVSDAIVGFIEPLDAKPQHQVSGSTVQQRIGAAHDLKLLLDALKKEM